MMRPNVSLLALGALIALIGTVNAGAQEREPGPEQRSTVFQAAERDAWLGISLDWSGGESSPVVVEAVVPGSPAARAGVAAGDTLVRLNGEAAVADAVRRLRPAPGDTVRLRLRRGGRERDLQVVAERRNGGVIIVRRDDQVTVIDPDSLRRRLSVRVDTLGAHLDSLFMRLDSMRVGTRARRLFQEMDSVVVRRFPETGPFSIEIGSRALAGAEFTQMNPGLGRYFQTEKGLLTLRVAPGSPAARAGLESGDVVVRVDGEEVETVRELRQAVARADDATARLEVIRQGRRREVTLRWERGGGPEVRVLEPDLRRPRQGVMD